MGWRDAVESSYQAEPLATAEQPPKSWREEVEQAEPSKWAKVKDFFTGSLRETEEMKVDPFTLPDNPGLSDDWKRFRVSLAMMTDLSDDGRMAAIAENFPGVVFDKDEKGNFIVDARAIGGSRGPLNPPGIDLRDAMVGGGLMAAFTPAGRAGVGSGLVVGSAKVGGASAATQAGLDLLGQSMGATGEGEERGAQVTDIDPFEVAMATVGGGFAEIIGRGLKVAAPYMGSFVRNLLTTVDDAPVDKAAKEQVKAALKDVDNYVEQTGEAMPRQQIIDVFAQKNIPEDVTLEIMKGIMPEEALGRASKAATEGSERFRIPLSEGERTGSPAMLQFEEASRLGAMGEGPRAAATALEQRKAAAIPQAVRTEAMKMSGDTPLPASAFEAAESATSGIQQRAQGLYQQVQDAYGAVPKGSRLSADGALGLVKAMRGALRSSEYDKTLPKTAQALGELGKMNKVLNLIKSRGKDKSVAFEEIENYRKRLGRYIQAAGDNADKAQLVQVKGALDEYMDTAVADGLMFGDNATIDAIKKARSLRREYSELFEPQANRTRAGVKDSDRAGVLINKMAELDPDPAEVVSGLFASGNAFGKNGSAELARRMRTALGPESPEWQQIRQAAMLRIFGIDKGQLSNSAKAGAIEISGQNALNRLQEVVGGRGRTLGRELFSSAEIDNMIELARAIKRAQPVPFNKSGTAGQLAYQNRLNSAAGKVFKAFQFTIDPTGGMLTDFARKGAAGISDQQATSLANQAFSGKPLQTISPSAGLRVLQGGATGQAVQQGQQAEQQPIPQRYSQ